MLRTMALPKTQQALAVGGVTLFAAAAAASLATVSSSLLTLEEACRLLGLGLFAIFAWKSRSLTPWIFFAMLAGGELGHDAPVFSSNLKFLSDIFLRLIKTIVAPLILASLINGIAGHGELKQVGRMGVKALIYFEVVTTFALAIGMAAINISKAGVGLTLPAASGTLPPAAPMHWQDFLVHVFPENIAKSIAEGQILQVAVFATIFGIALALLPEEKRTPLVRLMESFAEVMFRFTGIVMYLAPVAVGAAMAYTVGHMGASVLLPLGKLLLTLYLSLVAFILFILVPIALWAKIPLRRFVEFVAEPATIAFATATSEAALPTAMENMEQFGIPRRVVAFVIPAGYSFNLDGSALYLAMASLFVAQSANIHMGWGEQAMMLAMLVLTSKGIAGVPRAVLVVLMATATTFNLPLEPMLVLLGVDAVMDMGRTSLNVIGNCLACAVIARWEGELPAYTEE